MLKRIIVMIYLFGKEVSWVCNNTPGIAFFGHLHSMKMSKTYTWSELQHHNKTEDLFIVVRGSVYDVTKFQHEHP